MKLKLGLIPYVQDEEMKEIEEIFGTPDRRNHGRY
jgi:hypothetical protein